MEKKCRTKILSEYENHDLIDEIVFLNRNIILKIKFYDGDSENILINSFLNQDSSVKKSPLIENLNYQQKELKFIISVLKKKGMIVFDDKYQMFLHQQASKNIIKIIDAFKNGQISYDKAFGELKKILRHEKVVEDILRNLES